MKRVEYRVETVLLNGHVEELATRLNELGKDGWEVASVDLTPHPSYSPAAQPKTPVPVLLQRVIGE